MAFLDIKYRIRPTQKVVEVSSCNFLGRVGFGIRNKRLDFGLIRSDPDLEPLSLFPCTFLRNVVFRHYKIN